MELEENLPGILLSPRPLAKWESGHTRGSVRTADFRRDIEEVARSHMRAARSEELWTVGRGRAFLALALEVMSPKLSY